MIETRNIHFYVNRCGFHIVEYFNKYHRGAGANAEFDEEDEMFRFEKRLKRGTRYEKHLQYEMLHLLRNVTFTQKCYMY